MSERKKATTPITYTQVIGVVCCSEIEQLRTLMRGCGIARSETYNKLGSLQGWQLDWRKADPIIRKIIHPSQLGIPSKLFEWSVNDCMKAIAAQQEAAIVYLLTLTPNTSSRFYIYLHPPT